MIVGNIIIIIRKNLLLEISPMAPVFFSSFGFSRTVIVFVAESVALSSSVTYKVMVKVPLVL